MAMNRLSLVQVASYEERLKVWQDAVNAEETHIKLGYNLLAQGMKLLNTIMTMESIEKAAKCLQQANAAIEKGSKLETDGRARLIELYQQQPREK